MEQNEVTGKLEELSNEIKAQSSEQPGDVKDATPIAPSAENPVEPLISAQAGNAACNTCPTGSTAPSYIYALGRIEARFPSVSLEKELAQAASRSETDRLTDREMLHTVLSNPANRYLARQMCWVMTIEGIETYILQPRDSGDLAMLVDGLRPAPRPTDVDVVIGVRGPIAPPEMCNGLMIPIVLLDQMYSFDIDSLIKSIPRPDKTDKKEFERAAEELLMRLLLMADNAGAMDEHRALNYLVVRYPAIYAKVAEEYGKNASLTAVDVSPSRLSDTRKIVNVIFSYTNRQTDVTEKYFVRVDVTEEFPFLVTKLSTYFNV